MKNTFLEFLEKSIRNGNIVLSDGGLGTEILKRGIDISDIPPELLNIKNPEVIAEIHREYIKAGSNIITTNTFGANRYKLKSYGYENSVRDFCVTGIEIARAVRRIRTKKYCSRCKPVCCCDDWSDWKIIGTFGRVKNRRGL